MHIAPGCAVGIEQEKDDTNETSTCIYFMLSSFSLPAWTGSYLFYIFLRFIYLFFALAFSGIFIMLFFLLFSLIPYINRRCRTQ